MMKHSNDAKGIKQRARPTKRALDAGDSAAFSSIFLASSFFRSQIESTPAPAPVTQTVGQPRAKLLSSGDEISREEKS